MRRALMLALVLLAATSVFAANDVIKRGFNVADGGTLRLDASYGDVRIVTGGTGVAVEIVRKARGSKGEERLAQHKVTFSQQGNDVVVDSDDDERNDRGIFRWFDHDDFEVQWNVRVPDRYNVDVRTSGGSIELDPINGTVEARTSGGSIETGRLGGAAKLNTSGGSISIDGAAAQVDARTSGGSIRIGNTDGPVDARTSGGSIALARVRGPVTARTSGGNITIEDSTGSVDASTSGGSIRAQISGPVTADSKLSTSGGSVTVAIGAGVAVDLDAKASGGGITSDIPVTIMGRQDDDELKGKVNGGGPTLTLRTSGGGIRVRSLS